MNWRDVVDVLVDGSDDGEIWASMYLLACIRLRVQEEAAYALSDSLRAS